VNACFVYLDRARGKPIYLVGVEFSSEKREIVAFDVQTLAPTTQA